MDNQMIIYGNVGTHVDYREKDGFGWAYFRVASTPGYFDRKRQAWRDLETVWSTVKVTKSLATNAASSLGIGDPVVVIGRMRTQTWTDGQTGQEQRRDVVEASVVGHDLTRGTTVFARARPREEAPGGAEVGHLTPVESQDQPLSA